MRLYTAGLIEKSAQSANIILQKRLVAYYRKHLAIPASAIQSYELNTFIVLSGQKDGGPIESPLMESLEKKIQTSFTQYHLSNKSRFEHELTHNQELRETARIVKEFIKAVDPSLVKIFERRLATISQNIPNLHCEIQSRSIVTLWDIEVYRNRVALAGFASPIFTSSNRESDLNLEQLVDKLLLANFFRIFLKPTITRLQEMDRALERLKGGVEGTHYRSSNQKLQTKLDLFLRILTAKLSALNEVGSVLSRIFTLFQVPHTILPSYHFVNEAVSLNAELEEMASELKQGNALLTAVHDKLQACQVHLRDYFDEKKNGVKTLDSTADFQTQLMSMAELSIDLFVEAEQLKTWTDLFGSDIPYFSFDRHLLDPTNSSVFNVADDVILAVRGLTKNYTLGKTTVYALRGVNLDVKEGEFVAILGNSGAGKTTLLNCMAGLDTPDYGVVLFHGNNLHGFGDSVKSKARLLEMGFIFQTYTLLPHFNTRENVALPADLAGFSKELKDRIEHLLEGVGIDQQANQYPATLSGGQMQRVAIARALTNRPAIIFADEPTGDLDSVTGHQVMDLLKKFHEETRTTIILITHERDIANYAERQIVMDDGVIASPPSTRYRDGRRTRDTSTLRKTVPDQKLRQYSKLLPVIFVTQIALAFLIFFMLFQIDQLVHITLYSFELQFSNTWALPYWTFHRAAIGMLLLIVGLNVYLIAYILKGRHK